MNNFDQSSNSVNLELSCFYDVDLSRIYWNENFERDQYCNDLFHFIDHGNHKVIDLLDLDNYQFTKQMIIDGLLSHFNCSLEWLKSEFLSDQGLSFSKANKQDLTEYVETNLYHNENIIQFYQDHFNPLYEVITIYGHCQGDRADVIFPYEAMKEYTFKDRAKFLDTMQDYFTNLFYSCLVYCRLEINDDEICLDGALKDQYEYDRDLILQYAREHIKHGKKDYILSWLDDNLPIDYPDYK